MPPGSARGFGADSRKSCALRNVRSLIWPGLVIASSVLAAMVFPAADAWRRSVGPTESTSATIRSISSLYAGAAITAGLVVLACVGIERATSTALRRLHPWLARAVSAVWYSSLTALATWETAVFTFSGNRIKTTPYAVWGPYAMGGLLCAGVLLVVWLSVQAHQWIVRGQAWRPVLTAGAFLGAAMVLVYADLSLFVGLYSSLHVLLEGVAAGLAIAAVLILLRLLARGLPRTLFGFSWSLTVLAATSAGLGLAHARSRAEIDDILSYAWQEELYVGRMLRRMAMVEAFATREGDWQGVELARIDALRVRYDLPKTGRRARWDEPWNEAPAVAEAVQKLRGGPRPWNIVVFYVDTLRLDTASDPETMPNAVGFGADNLRFENAYTSGSDTIRALPGITGGNYDFSLVQPGDLLGVAKSAGMKRMLTVGDSALSFLKAHRPEFAFDDTISIEDHAPGKQVWGYGADQLTSARLVDTAVAWIEKNRDTPFLTWILTYDQHAWQELPVPRLEAEAVRLNLPTKDQPGRQHWRYRVVARLVDEQFGRLLGELDRLGVADETIVLFLSDHGESLGREGFWAHSVFLWEELVHVPLILRIPGLGSGTVRDRVSLIDLAPTLARYLLEDPPLDGYHGEDLLSHLVPGRPSRRHPIVMASVSGLSLSRVGIIDETGRWKLVIPFGTARPELYDLDSNDLDENVAKQKPNIAARLLGEAVGSPLFPRRLSDFQAFIYH